MSTASNYDSAWKDALESYFPEFMILLWPGLHAQIDWNHALVFRDKELQALMRSAKRGRRHVDKLVSVRLLNGQDTLLLIHVEIQAGQESGFAHRMYTYYVRLYEKYPGDDIVSLAVLSNAPARRATSSMTHTMQFWHCRLSFTFPVVYLEGWRHRTSELLVLAPRNPFAVVLLAQLEANATRPDKRRFVRKAELVRRLYHWGYQRDNVLMLFRIIDAMMTLPKALESAFEAVIQRIEEETQMSYVTSIERVRLKREREEGKAEGFAALLSTLITRKFGTLPDWAKVRLVAADDATLQHWAEQILDAEYIEDVFK